MSVSERNKPMNYREAKLTSPKVPTLKERFIEFVNYHRIVLRNILLAPFRLTKVIFFPIFCLIMFLSILTWPIHFIFLTSLGYVLFGKFDKFLARSKYTDDLYIPYFEKFPESWLEKYWDFLEKKK